MPNSTSLVRRVAQASALAASVAALFAAIATSVLASYFIQRGEDRRLTEAAVTFAAELDQDGSNLAAIREVHRDESDEMDHTGMLFAVYDADGRLLVGDRRVSQPATPGCANDSSTALRLCRVQSKQGLAAVVGASHSTYVPILASATILSALLAAALAWFATQPISRFVVAPLTQLRERIAGLDVDAISEADLGHSEGVLEVDALRHTLGELISRVERALALAHRFAANAAHELRTPLTSLRAELELLSESLRDSAFRADASHAEQKVAELSVLVERLLILSVPAQGETDVHEVVSLRDLLEDAVQALPTADRSRVALSDEDALIHGDATLLATMISNAFANGLKFADHVSTRLTLRDREAVLHVDDDGPGVESADRERVFEPFFRAQAALRRRVPGSGLGLALIRHIAQTHGGHAAFTEKHARGARLEIRLRV